MSSKPNTDLMSQQYGRFTRLINTKVTHENAQSTAWIGSITAGLTVQALANEGVEGAIFGGTASVAGLLTLVSLLSISIPLPLVVIVGITGGVLGGMRKPSRQSRISDSQ